MSNMKGYWRTLPSELLRTSFQCFRVCLSTQVDWLLLMLGDAKTRQLRERGLMRVFLLQMGDEVVPE
jgi:hypothetical protein